MAMRARAVTASESSGRANENGTVHFKEWMTAIISMTKRDTLLLQGMDSWTLINGLSLRFYKKPINKQWCYLGLNKYLLSKIMFHMIPERMDDCNRLCKKPQQLKKTNERSLLLSVTHYFKKWTTRSGVLKKNYFLYKNGMLQIDPLKRSSSQKQQYPERT